MQDEYVLLEPIGEHAGEVFRARHLRDRRDVIVRIWRSQDAVARDRWLERARLASRVRHPVLPAVETYGKHGDEYAYAVSEYAEGERLDHFSDRNGIPPVASVVELFRHVCVGLNAAHRNGLAHEALHPCNLLVTEQAGDPLRRLSARLLDLVVPAFMRGMPSLQDALFMSPEQLAAWLAPGEHAPPPADVRGNIYSCGCLLHYVCTGGAPIQARTIEELSRAHASGRVVPASRINPQIPPALDAVILRALSPLPDARFASMAELAIALERVHTGSSASGVRPRVEPSVAGAFRERTETARSPFDERPTSEALRLPLPTPLRPPPPPPPAQAEEARKSEPGSEPRNAPIGLFSSSPPPPPAAPHVPPVPPVPIDSSRPRFSLPNAGTSLRAFEREAVRSLFTGRRMPSHRSLAIAAALLSAVLWVWGVRTARHAAVTPSTTARRSAASGAPTVVAPALPAPVIAVQPPPAIAPSVEPAPAPVAAPAPPVDPRGTRARWHKTAARNVEAAVAEDDARSSAPDMPHDLDEPHALAVTPREAPSTVERAEPPAQAPSPEPEAAPSRAAQVEVSTPVRPAADARAQSATVRPPALPLRARAQSSDISVHGSLANSVVRRAVERLTAQLSACYVKAATAAGHNAFGTLEVEIEIDEHGRARGVQVHGAALPGLGACVAQTTSRLAADRPPDTGTVKASWKVAFTP